MAQDTFYIYGVNTLLNLLQEHPERIRSLHLAVQRKDHRINEITELAKQHGISIERVDDDLLQKKTGSSNHQGVMAVVVPPVVRTEKDLYSQLKNMSQPFLLVLDGVTDPHNLGACFRSAEAAGVDAIIVPKDRACHITPTVSKVACGAAELVPFYQVTNLARCLQKLKDAGVWCIGLAGEGPASLFDTDITGPLALVLGAEGQGLRRLSKESCDSIVHLPMCGSISSLNVSVTTGIALFEAIRQKSAKNRKK